MYQQPKQLERVFRALAREGLDVRQEDGVYEVRNANARPDLPAAKLLLPETFPLEAKALKQLATLAAASHPAGGKVCQACATPDFHPGDRGIAIGSVAQTRNMVIPAAVGGDINCGMRLHVTDLDRERFHGKEEDLVQLMRGDYLLGTRDVPLTRQSAIGMFRSGIQGWLDAMLDTPVGLAKHLPLELIVEEIDRVFDGGSMVGHEQWAPDDLISHRELLRDDGLATIGGGNHFVEIQWVEEILDRHTAWQWGIRQGQVAFMIHSGSRSVGKYIGGHWRRMARSLWPKGMPAPSDDLFPLSLETHEEEVHAYLNAQATAANYGFVNRMLLAECMRHRLRQVFGDLEAPLIYDLPHNLTLPDGDGGWISRKGACPAYKGEPVIIPGSMGAPSYLLRGGGNDTFLNSASHGAGRAHSRFSMGRRGAGHTDKSLGLEGIRCETLREERRIEEAPAAYKPIQSVIDSQIEHGLVQPVARLQPLITFKA